MARVSAPTQWCSAFSRCTTPKSCVHSRGLSQGHSCMMICSLDHERWYAGLCIVAIDGESSRLAVHTILRIHITRFSSTITNVVTRI